MPEHRHFIVRKVTKSSQNQNTSFNDTRKYTGTPSSAAKKAMTHICGRIGKKVKGQCTMTVTVQEVKSTGTPIMDSQGLPVMYKYKLKRSVAKDPENDTSGVTVVFNGGLPITFKYQTKIVESYGRVLQ
jgi:hypothetical protein